MAAAHIKKFTNSSTNLYGAPFTGLFQGWTTLPSIAKAVGGGKRVVFLEAPVVTPITPADFWTNVQGAFQV